MPYSFLMFCAFNNKKIPPKRTSFRRDINLASCRQKERERTGQEQLTRACRDMPVRCSGCIWIDRCTPLYKNMALWNMIPCMTERNDKDTQILPGFLLPGKRVCKSSAAVQSSNNHISVSHLSLYYIVLISCIAVLRPILIIGDGKYNVKVEKIILSAYFVRSRVRAEVWSEVWALRACGLHFDACIYKIIIKTLSVHCFPMRIRL